MKKPIIAPFELIPLADRIGRFFQFDVLGTNYRTELLASLTSFMTLAPILVVNAHLLGKAVFLEQPGDLFEQILVAIAICSAVSSIAIGFLANYPIALTPGTGTIALFAFSVVLGMGMNWRLALTAALVEGIAFTGLSLSPFRRLLNDAIPNYLKRAMVVGIGLFLAYIALSGKVTAPTLGAGIIVASTTTTTSFGSLKEPATLIAIFGIFSTVVLTVRRVKGALALGIFGTALLGWFWGVAPLPKSILSLPQFPIDLVGQAIWGFEYLNWSELASFVAVVFILLFVSLCDTFNSLNVLGYQLDRIESNGELHRFKPALLCNTLGTAFGAIVGSVPVLPHIASTSGIFEGGRSGFVAIAVGILFLLSALFAPLFAAIPAFATAPVLLLIGVLMMSGARSIDWQDLGEGIPAFLVISTMPLAFSVADGMAVGFIAHAVVKVARQERQGRLSSLILGGMAAVYFLLITFQK